MDFITGALPNVMFIAGVIAIGTAIGFEFKIIEVKGQLNRTGRIAAFCVGLLLIGFSIHLYTRPNQTAAAPLAAPSTQPVAQANMSGNIISSGQSTQTPQTTATPAPELQAGTPVTIDGVIERLGVSGDSTIVIIKRTQYLIPSALAVRLGPALQVGVHIQFVGNRLNDGTVVAANVTILDGTPGKGDKEDKEDKDGKHEKD